MKVSNQDIRDYEDGPDLEIANFECDIDLESEIAALELEQGSRSQGNRETEGYIDHEFEGIEGDERRDYPSSHQPINEVLFDDDIVILNSKYQNNITRFQLGETLQPSEVRTLGPRLVAKWCMQLAKQGNHRAQYRLGRMYAQGFGVQRNYIMAYTWCKISARRHSPGALLKLKEIEPNLTAMHLYYARKLSRRYYEKFVVPFSHK